MDIPANRSSIYCSGANKGINRKYAMSKKEVKILDLKIVELIKEEITGKMEG